MRSKSIFILAALTVAAWAGLRAEGIESPSLDRVYVYLRPAAETTSGQILLGNIAEVEGFDKALIARVSELPLGPAPMPGASLTIEKPEIRRSMVTHRIDPVRVALLGENRVEVTRSGRVITRAELTGLVKDYLARSWESAPDVRTETIYSRLPEDFTLESENFTLEVLTPLKPGATGSIALSVAAVDEGRILARVPISLKVRVFRKVAVVNKALRQGELLSPDDLDFVEREITRNQANAVSNPVDAAGKRLKRNISAGRVLTADYLENPPLIERGDEITLLVEYRGIRIGCPGKAWQSGGLGEKILVRNHYGKNLVGKVKNAHTVLITQ